MIAVGKHFLANKIKTTLKFFIYFHHLTDKRKKSKKQTTKYHAQEVQISCQFIPKDTKRAFGHNINTPQTQRK